MNRNDRTRIYAISITIIAAILLIAVIILAVRLRTERGSAGQQNSGAVIKEAEETEETAEETQAEPEAETGTEPDADAGTDDSKTDSEVVQKESRIEAQTDNSVYNVGGIVGWESGNNDSINIINAWKNMLKQLDVDADIVFLGDSITHRYDFRPYFPDSTVVNLGCGGDTIRGVYNRCEMLSYVNAEKIVVMCGVNVLRADTVDFCRTEYAGLLNAITEYSPDSDVYVCSILPMRKDWQDAYCSYETTEKFNEIIKELAENRGMTYVDLYPLFLQGNEIDPEYTVDGIHLSDKGYDLWMNALYPYMYN